MTEQEVTCRKMGNKGGEGETREREDARMCGKTQANRKRQQWKTQSLFGKVNKSFISKQSKSKKLPNTFLIFKIIKVIFVKISTCSSKTAGGVK